jgi:hypothetical protein
MDRLHARALRVTLFGLIWIVGVTLIFEKWDEWKYSVIFLGALSLVVVLLIVSPPLGTVLRTFENRSRSHENRSR